MLWDGGGKNVHLTLPSHMPFTLHPFKKQSDLIDLIDFF